MALIPRMQLRGSGISVSMLCWNLSASAAVLWISGAGGRFAVLGERLAFETKTSFGFAKGENGIYSLGKTRTQAWRRALRSQFQFSDADFRSLVALAHDGPEFAVGQQAQPDLQPAVAPASRSI